MFFKFFQRPRIALALRARAILLVLIKKKFTRAYLFQIALWRNHVITYTKR